MHSAHADTSIVPDTTAPASTATAISSDTAILLCNLGTPDAPTAPALRRYLAQFLGDPRVVEIPPLAWRPILHGIILRTRPAKSAAKYASIWTDQGSPLAVWTARQAALLGAALSRDAMGQPAPQAARAVPAMRYGQPAIGAQLQALQGAGVRRVLVLPLYPQYSSTTTASVFDDVAAWVRQSRCFPELRFVNDYHGHPGYIAALAQSVRAHWQREGGPADRLVMSFHGIPERNVRLGDPYAEQCRATARLLAQALGLDEARYLITFQSRFGKARWLEPYTEPTLVALAQGGTRRVDVICPGFPCDCLETLEEINQEARHAFLHAGGEAFRYIPCLNDSPAWISALGHIARQHLAGWGS